MSKSSPWAHLEFKYKITNRPHRILSLDGGGIRGLITLEILAKLESELRKKTGNAELLLGEWFDLIGGTSTGAIIAAGLSRGMSVDALKDFYVSSALQMFTKAFFLNRLTTKFNEAPLRQKLQEVFGDQDGIGLTESDKWKCMMVAVTTNWNTLSPWPISNNPFAKYNDLDRPDCNLKIPLWQLVRASTAAPTYFVPEVIQWDSNDLNKRFVFVDGGMTPYNNPAFQLFRMCTAQPYHLGWPTGEDNLLILSIGTGAPLSKRHKVGEGGDNLLTNASEIPSKLMNGINAEQDLNCRTVGKCLFGQSIDREIGDLIPRASDGRIDHTTNLGRAFSYMRFNADLSEIGLEALGLSGINADKVSELDCVEEADNLIRIGQAVSKDIPSAVAMLPNFLN